MAALTRGRKNMDGMNTERALEYMTASSRIQVDSAGDTSSTNMASVYQRMDEFMPEAKKVLKDKSTARVEKAAIDAFKTARTFDDKMELLRKNKDMGNQFTDKMRTGGPKELAFALIQNNAATQKIMAESKEAVLPFKEAGKFFRAETEKIQAAAPNLAIKKQADARLEQSITGDQPTLLATARAEWDSIWSGNAERPAIELEGWDKGARAQAWMQRTSKSQSRSFGTLKDGGNEVTDMATEVKELIKREIQAGNSISADALKAPLQALETIAAKLSALEGQPVQAKVAARKAPDNVAKPEIAIIKPKPVEEPVKASVKPVVSSDNSGLKPVVAAIGTGPTQEEKEYYVAVKNMTGAEPNRKNRERYYTARENMLSKKPAKYASDEEYERTVMLQGDSTLAGKSTRSPTSGAAEIVQTIKNQNKALEDIAAGIQELNTRVAGAPPPAVGRPNPVRPAPVPRPAVVP
jgi:hypothetical protein